MDVHEFSEGEWRDVLEEFRLLVVRAGYAEWDASMFESIADDESDRERLTPAPRASVEDLRRYVGAFLRFLKTRSSFTRDERRDQLANFLHTESGASVKDFVVSFDGQEQPIFSGIDNLDAMIEELGRLLAELNGESSGFWQSEADDGEDDS